MDSNASPRYHYVQQHIRPNTKRHSFLTLHKRMSLGYTKTSLLKREQIKACLHKYLFLPKTCLHKHASLQKKKKNVPQEIVSHQKTCPQQNIFIRKSVLSKRAAMKTCPYKNVSHKNVFVDKRVPRKLVPRKARPHEIDFTERIDFKTMPMSSMCCVYL
jgi:hypothetical protein